MSAKNNKITIGKLTFTFIYILIFPALILLLSGDFLWVEGIIFCVWFIALCATAIIYLYRKDPALLLERYKAPGSGGQKGWDVFVVIGLVIGFTAWIVLIPLDAKRFVWTAFFPVWLKVAGGIFLLFSAYFFLRAYMDNTYLSALVRVQEERKHRVITTGVYGIVRHPMYLGGTLLFIGAPLLMDSFYGLILGICMMILLMARIIGEEKMLITELEGYEEYKEKVKYRLIPYIW